MSYSGRAHRRSLIPLCREVYYGRFTSALTAKCDIVMTAFASEDTAGSPRFVAFEGASHKDSSSSCNLGQLVKTIHSESDEFDGNAWRSTTGAIFFGVATGVHIHLKPTSICCIVGGGGGRKYHTWFSKRLFVYTQVCESKPEVRRKAFVLTIGIGRSSNLKSGVQQCWETQRMQRIFMFFLSKLRIAWGTVRGHRKSSQKPSETNKIVMFIYYNFAYNKYKHNYFIPIPIVTTNAFLVYSDEGESRNVRTKKFGFLSVLTY